MKLPAAAAELLQPFRGGDLLLDTNLLLLKVIGDVEIELVSRFSRTGDRFDPRDYLLLNCCLQEFQNRKILSTPNIVTETSHFLDELRDLERRSAAYEKLRRLIGGFDERYIPSEDALSHEAIIMFGVADSANLVAIKEKALLLTVDARLVDWAQRKKLPALNYHYLRP